MNTLIFNEKKFNLPSMTGLSDKQITEHLKLYAGYVKNSNLLLDKIKLESEKESPDTVIISELRRRLGFEYNGMRLHENYFGSLGGNGDVTKANALSSKLEAQFGTAQKMIDEIKKISVMRGIGWVLLTHDKETDSLMLNWVSDHELGHLAGTKIILALDVWEHAYLLDYLPSERSKYVESFFQNIDWSKVDENFKN